MRVVEELTLMRKSISVRPVVRALTAAAILTAIPLSVRAASLPAAIPESRMLALPSGETLKVTTLGTGEPVVLVPGLFGSAYGFRKVMPRLAAAGWRAIVIEPLGVGE